MINYSRLEQDQRMKFFQLDPYLYRKGHRLCLFLTIFLLAILLPACLEANPAPSPLPPTANVTKSQTLPTATQATPFQPQDTPAPASATLSPTRTTQPANSTGIQPGALEGLTVQFWYTGSEQAGRAWEDLVEEFNVANEWGLHVQASEAGNYDQLDSRLEAALQNGAPPDLVTALTYQAAGWDIGQVNPGQVNSGSESQVEGTAAATTVPSPADGTATATATPEREAQSTGLITDLNSYVNDPDWGLNTGEQEDFYPAFWEAEALDGKRLGLPAVRSAQVLFYNQSWAEELGFQGPPATPQQFQEQACAAAQAIRADDDPKNDGAGGLAISTQPAAMAGWLESFGSEFARPDESGYRFNTSQVEDAFGFLRGLYDAGCAWLSENDSYTNDFASRRALFTAGSLADLPGQLAIMEQAGSQDRWTLLPFPSPDGQPAINAYGPSYVILKTSPERQLAAWLFARWLSEPERQAALALASGNLPTRRSAAQQLSALSSSSAQWHAGLGLIETARMEPSFASWSTVRWALGDAATQLFRYYFTADGIPSLVELLDETAQELHERSPEE